MGLRPSVGLLRLVRGRECLACLLVMIVFFFGVFVARLAGGERSVEGERRGGEVDSGACGVAVREKKDVEWEWAWEWAWVVECAKSSRWSGLATAEYYMQPVCGWDRQLTSSGEAAPLFVLLSERKGGHGRSERASDPAIQDRANVVGVVGRADDQRTLSEGLPTPFRVRTFCAKRKIKSLGLGWEQRGVWVWVWVCV